MADTLKLPRTARTSALELRLRAAIERAVREQLSAAKSR